MRQSDLKITTEALICAAQEQAIRTNHIKYNIDKIADSPRHVDYVKKEVKLCVI